MNEIKPFYLGYDDCISCVSEQAKDILNNGMLNVDYQCPNRLLRAIKSKCHGYHCLRIINRAYDDFKINNFCAPCWISIYALRDFGMPEEDAIEKIRSGIIEVDNILGK